MALLVFYVVNLFKTAKIKSDMKVLWAVVLLLGNIIAMPIYWYLYIWKESPDVIPASPNTPTSQ